MKKLYFMLAAMLISFAANAASSKLYIIGQPAGGWDANKGLELQQTAPGVFTYEAHFTGATFFAFADQLGSNANDWNGLNSHRYGPAVNNATAKGDTNQMYYPKDAAWQMPKGDYTLTIDTNTMNLKVDGIVDDTIKALWLMGTFNDWTAEAQYKFTASDDLKIFTLSGVTIPAGETFKICTEDKGHSFSTEDTAMELDTPYEYVDGGIGNDMGFATAMGNLTVTINLNSQKITFTQGSGPVAEETYYLVGAKVGSHKDCWNAPYADDLKFAKKAPGVYEITVSELASSFKVNNGSWAMEIGAGEGKVKVGEPYTYSTAAGCGNLTFDGAVTSVTDAKVTLNTNNMTITVAGTPVEAEKEWYVVGLNDMMFSWDKAIKMSKTSVDNVFEAKDVEIKEDGSFKISTMDWGEQYGASDETLPIDADNLEATLVEVSNEAALTYELPIGNKYTITWNYDTKVVKFALTSSGIADVAAEAEAAPAEYYNIQGMKVANPKGLVIRKQGDKVEKVIL